MTCLIREHTSQGSENGPLRYGAVNGLETDGRVLENFRNLFSAVHGSRKVNQFLKQQQTAVGVVSSSYLMKETEHNSSVLQTRYMDPRIFLSSI